jgi:hypothetical protein
MSFLTCNYVRSRWHSKFSSFELTKLNLGFGECNWKKVELFYHVYDLSNIIAFEEKFIIAYKSIICYFILPTNTALVYLGAQTF